MYVNEFCKWVRNCLLSYILMRGYRKQLIITFVVLKCTLPVETVLGQALMVDQAYTLLKQGQLDKSQQAIDIAVEHSSTINDAKAWYLRGFIYQKLAEQDATSAHELRRVSIASAEHCLELDTLNQFTKDCQSLISHAYNSFLKEVISFLNTQEYAEVFTPLQPIIDSEHVLAQNYKPEALFYYGYAALQLGQRDSARQYLFKALQAGYQDALVYEIEFAHRASLLQYDSARWYLSQGRALFPENASLHIAELNFLMQQENYKQAEQSVKQYLQRDPDNVEGLLLAGTIYEKLLAAGENTRQYFTEQEATYQHILQITPDHLQANYNLGIAYYNRGVTLINEAAQSYDMDLIQFNQLLEECSTLFLTALPYLEKVSQLDRSHVNALKALQGVYYNINDYEQYNLVKEKLQKL